MHDLGAEFRRLREAKGATLEQVAAATKVGIHHLDALENGDHDALPDDVFVRGFIRAYADFLGANPDRLLALNRRDRQRLEPDAAAAAQRTVQEMSRLLVGAGGAVHRRGLVVRIKVDQRLVRLALGAGGFAAAVGAVAVLTMVLSEGRGIEEARPEIPAPLRSTHGATEVPVQSPSPLPPPPAAPAPAPAVETEENPVEVPPGDEGLAVPEHGVGSGVEDGRLVGKAATFEEGAAVWFWTRIDGGRPGQVVHHVWLHEDREVHTVDLEVGGAPWRTWSRKTLRPGSAGRWSVEARDAYGRVLASDEFDCRPNR